MVERLQNDVHGEPEPFSNPLLIGQIFSLLPENLVSGHSSQCHLSNHNTLEANPGPIINLYKHGKES